MRGAIRAFSVAVTAALAVHQASHAADIDRTAVQFTVPADIKWVRNAAGTNQQAILFGDPSKPGLYVARVKWLPGNMSRPHFHPHDRFFAVISGTWWVGTGEKFDPDSTVPVPRRKLRHPLRQQDPLRRRERRGNRHPGVGHGTCDLHACRETLSQAGLR